MYIIQGLPHKKEEVDQNIRQYWPIRNKLAVIDGILMKGKRIIIPLQLQKMLQYLHSNNMGIEKIMLPMCSSVYWLHMNAHIKNTVK